MKIIKTIELQSKLENIKEVENLVADIKIDYCVTEKQYGKMLLACVEAVNNAIKHGNKLEENKKVQFEVYKCATGNITFKIQDEGNGFDDQKLKDPTAPENLETENGRGVFIIKQLADDVRFLKNGSCIEMKFNF